MVQLHKLWHSKEEKEMKTAFELFTDFIDNLHVDSKVMDVFVTSDLDGNFVLFNKYIITRQDGFYLVEIKSIYGQLEFYSIRNAIAWCTMHNSGRYIDAKTILGLDNKIVGINFDISVYRRQLKNAKTEDVEMYEIMLADSLYRKKAVIQNLKKYINTSRQVQEQKFKKLKTNVFV